MPLPTGHGSATSRVDCRTSTGAISSTRPNAASAVIGRNIPAAETHTNSNVHRQQESLSCLESSLHGLCWADELKSGGEAAAPEAVFRWSSGEALVAIESLGYSAHACEAAVNRLDRKFGGEQRQTNLQFEEIESFPALRTGRPGDLQRFADLLDVLIVNMVDAGKEYELGDGLLFR